MKRTVVLLIVFTLGLITVFFGRKRHKPAGDETFDYYLLSLSWAPNYCADHPGDNSSECRTGNHTAFVLHGLWPSSNSGAQPMSCAPARPVAADTVRRMLNFFPSRGLIQHEWEKHGTCSGLSAQEYFGKAEKAFTAVKLPARYRNLDHTQQIATSDVERDFAAENNAPKDAFRLSCHAGALVSVEACLDKNLQYQACPASARECPSSQVSLAPVK